jgi:hypothetical protein
MKLIALITIIASGNSVRPGGPVELSDSEGATLVARQFARHPTEAELAQHWPHAAADAEAEAKAKAAAEAEAAAKAQAEAEAAALAEAEAKIKADAEAAAIKAAKNTKAKSGNG